MIPKPQNLSHYGMGNLRAALNISEELFETLKKAVHEAADWHLEVDRSIGKQESANWQRFTTELVQLFPELDEYQERWPLLILLRPWKKKIQRLTKRLDDSTTLQANLVLPDADHSHHGRERRNGRMFIGKPLPRRLKYEPRSYDTRDDKECAFNNRRVGSSTSCDINPSGQVQSPDSKVECQKIQSHKPVEIVEAVEARRIYVVVHGNLVPCLACDYLPQIPNTAKAKILATFQSDNLSISSLLALGVCNDKQLLLLLSLSAWGMGPEQFFGSIPNNELNLLYRVHILRQLKSQPGLIPRPSSDIEARLVDGRFASSPLWRIFGLAHDAEERCIRIIQTVNEVSWKADSVLARDHGKEIDTMFPFLGVYEDNWPLSLHLKWKSHRERSMDHPETNSPPTSNGALGNGLASTVRSAATLNPPKDYQVPLSNCPAHPPSGLSAPEKLQVLLGTFGMEELTPLFLTAHVKSDDDYYLLRGLDERERLTVFDEQLRVLHVRRFQRWMLQFALKIIDLY